MTELSLTAEDVAFSLGPDHLLGPGRRGMSQALQSFDRSRKSKSLILLSSLPRAATRSSSSVWLLTSSSTTSSIFVSRWLLTIRIGAVAPPFDGIE